MPLPSLEFLLAALLLFSLVLSLSPVISADDRVLAVINAGQPVSRPISAAYIGFSLEHDLAANWTGRDHLRQSFVTLIRQLRLNRDSAQPVFRIGGNSADYSLYNPQHAPLPNASSGFPFTHSIDDEEIAAVARGVAAAGGQLIVGLNFRRPENASWAAEHLLALRRIVGWQSDSVLRGVEIGNEPDIYAGNGNRPANYTLKEYYTDFARYVQQLRAAAPDLPAHFIQGALYCCQTAWRDRLPEYIRAFTAELFKVGVHHYPFAACDPRTTPKLADLLTEDAASKLSLSLLNSSVGNLIEQVNALGYNLSQSEGNSVACSGAPNVSNTFGADLWVVDELFYSASAGLSEYVFHSHDGNLSHYPPIVWQDSEDDTPTVQPEFYALLFFALATSSDSQLVQFAVTDSSNDRVRVWPTVSDSGVIKVVVLHKDLNATLPASVVLDLSSSLTAPYPVAELIRLTCDSPYATYGISFAGLTYDGTVDGTPSGEVLIENVMADDGGRYAFSVSPISLVMIRFVPAEVDAGPFIPIPYHSRQQRRDVKME